MVAPHETAVLRDAGGLSCLARQVTSAAKSETRRSRLERVIAMCAVGKKF
jgi:hypothetical protein